MVKSEPLVSILMPAYNAEKYVEEAIDSIIAQTYKSWELLVCDDASSDNTFRIIEHYPQKDHRIKLFKNERNLKELNTRNILLQHAKGGLITFQDADDHSHSHRIKRMVSEFDKNPKLGLLSTQVAYIDKTGTILRTSNKPLTYVEVKQKMYDRNVVGGAIMMIRRDALTSVGGRYRSYFDGLSYLDYDLSLLVAEKYEAYSLPDVLYFYRQHSTASSKEISIERHLAIEVVQHLARQRREKGTDDLIERYPEKVDDFFRSLKMPFYKDPSLIYRNFASHFMYNKLTRKAIQVAWIGCLKRPLYFTNWRTLQYCIRKTLLHNLALWF